MHAWTLISDVKSRSAGFCSSTKRKLSLLTFLFLVSTTTQFMGFEVWTGNTILWHHHACGFNTSLTYQACAEFHIHISLSRASLSHVRLKTFHKHQALPVKVYVNQTTCKWVTSTWQRNKCSGFACETQELQYLNVTLMTIDLSACLSACKAIKLLKPFQASVIYILFLYYLLGV